jgi:FkbM family methyltransferase
MNWLGALVSRHVPRDATVIDVGANIGLSAITLARLAKRVIAFEPSPPNVEYLRRNLMLNGIDNVEVVAAAVSTKAVGLPFHVAQFGAGSHVVSSGHLLPSLATIDVPAVELDQFDFPPIDFIKIDVEGHEPEVLAGARRLLARDRPLIQMEVNIWCLMALADHSPGALVRKLWEKFEVWAPAADGSLTHLGSGFTFLHRTLLETRSIADIVLRARDGVEMPTLPELSWPAAALAALGTNRETGPGC